MDMPPADTKQPWDLKQWLKDYGVFAALLTLGIPALFYLGAMYEQVRGMDQTITPEIKPELKQLRNLIEGQDGLRTQVIQVHAQLRVLDSTTTATQQGVGDLSVRLRTLGMDIRDISKQILETKQALLGQVRQIGNIAKERERRVPAATR